MSQGSVSELISSAVALRQRGEAEEALTVLLGLAESRPDDPVVNLQCAWTHDTLGLEREAVPFYERAIELGLSTEDLRGALLGLGSTLRALGRYDESLQTLDRAVEEYPSDRSFQVFRAMTLHNQGRSKEACEILLRILVETTGDESIIRYRVALSEYARDLDRTW